MKPRLPKPKSLQISFARFLMEEIRPENVEVDLVHIMPFMRYPELRKAGQALLDRDDARLAKAGYTVTETLKPGQPAG